MSFLIYIEYLKRQKKIHNFRQFTFRTLGIVGCGSFQVRRTYVHRQRSNTTVELHRRPSFDCVVWIFVLFGLLGAKHAGNLSCGSQAGVNGAGRTVSQGASLYLSK